MTGRILARTSAIPVERLLAGLACSLEGDTDRRAPLVLRHGLTFDCTMWWPALAELRQVDPGRRILAVDLPGHGQSPAWPCYDFEGIADQVHRAVREAKLPSPVLVGHSAGAVIATSYASRYPARGVVNVDQWLQAEPLARLFQSLAGQLRGPGFRAAWEMVEAGMHIRPAAAGSSSPPGTRPVPGQARTVQIVPRRFTPCGRQRRGSARLLNGRFNRLDLQKLSDRGEPMPADLPDASERLRKRAAAELEARLPSHLGRLGWDRVRLAAHQRDRLRELLACAAANSRFHARRLAGIDLDRFEVADLPRLPVMTKAEMMTRFDDVVTDRRVSMRQVQAHLDASKTRASLLLDEFVCLASGGSSGVRGVFVQTAGSYMDFMASFISPAVARNGVGGTGPGGLVAAVVAAGSPIHSSALAAVTVNDPVRLVPVPATLPLGEITERLNALRPPVLIGYPTMLALLAAQQRAGRLRIAPAAISASSEQLTDQDRAAISAAFGVPVTDQFASTEGLSGHSDPGGQVLTFATDMCIVELVTADHRPVPLGTPADKVLVTNLHNLTQPLIRYELTDRFVRHPDDSAGRLRAAVDGRADSVFWYGGIAVHPITFYSVLEDVAAITEFQVRQRRRGVIIDVVADGDLDKPALRDAVRRGLTRCGLEWPEVAIRAVTSIERHAETGKVLRFLPSQA